MQAGPPAYAHLDASVAHTHILGFYPPLQTQIQEITKSRSIKETSETTTSK